MPRHPPCALSSLTIVLSIPFVMLESLSGSRCTRHEIVKMTSATSFLHQSFNFFASLFFRFIFIQFSRCGAVVRLANHAFTTSCGRVLRAIGKVVPLLCLKKALVGSNGLEPSTSRLSGVRSNHLSYEPISAAFRSVLPAYHLVEMNRFELSTPCLQGRCSPN